MAFVAELMGTIPNAEVTSRPPVKPDSPTSRFFDDTLIFSICAGSEEFPVNTSNLKRASDGRRSCISTGRASAARKKICGKRRCPTVRFSASDWCLLSVMADGA